MGDYMTKIFAILFVAFFGILVGCNSQTPKQNKKVMGIWVDEPIKDRTVQSVEKNTQYVMILFSATGSARYSHSFALFAKVEDSEVKDKVIISWLPKNQQVNIVSVKAEEGSNLDLGETFRWARRNDAQLERFGPYVVDSALFLRAKEQEARLKSGNVYFKFNDTDLRPNTCNSAHAISDIVSDGQTFLATGGSRGKEATEIVKIYFNDYINQKLPDDQKLLYNLGCQGIRRLD